VLWSGSSWCHTYGSRAPQETGSGVLVPLPQAGSEGARETSRAAPWLLCNSPQQCKMIAAGRATHVCSRSLGLATALYDMHGASVCAECHCSALHSLVWVILCMHAIMVASMQNSCFLYRTRHYGQRKSMDGPGLVQGGTQAILRRVQGTFRSWMHSGWQIR